MLQYSLKQFEAQFSILFLRYSNTRAHVRFLLFKKFILCQSLSHLQTLVIALCMRRRYCRSKIFGAGLLGAF